MNLKSRLYFDRIYRNWLSVAFLLGFVGDLLLLNRIDDVIDNAILLFNFSLATFSMIILYGAIAEKFPSFINHRLEKFAPAAMQYAFGGLLSGMLIFYGRSGDWMNSAPFLALILLAILGNEFVKKRSERLLYHLSLYFLGTLSYFVLVLPVLLGRMGDLVFVFSGLLALVMVILVIKILLLIIPNFIRHNLRNIVFSIGMIYVGFNTLYFTNIIPPIPLSLTELSIVHSVSRTETGQYVIVDEPKPWYQNLPFIPPTIHPQSGRGIACFAKVYAPTRLSTEVFHRWEYKDTEGNWQQHFRLAYSITGENQNGYRGYTSITSFFDGTWRCSVESLRGQVLGRRTFVIDSTVPPSDLYTRVD